MRLCRHHAKLPAHDSWDPLGDSRYKIELPPPSLYGQFNNLEDIDIVLNGLLAIGFDEVYEVGQAAEFVTDATKTLMQYGGIESPIISTACPAVVELLMMR